MTPLFTARARFNKDSDANNLSWSNYIAWSKLSHLSELVSLDCSLNEVLIDPDRNDDTEWEEIVIDNYYETGLFKTFNYVLKKINDKKWFNLLRVVVNPESDCSLLKFEEYCFLGYDLLDQFYGNSALTNCGGFDETFQASDLNNVGLINDYEKAYTIKNQLRENNPMEEHANTNVIAIWRHETIGRG